MKRFWVAVAILAVIFSAALYHTHYLHGFTAQLSALLTQAEAQSGRDNWADTERLTELAYRAWQRHDIYLHVLLRHSDTDEVYVSFHEVQSLIDHRADEQYPAANARLITQIGLLHEAEQLSLKNVF